MTRRMMAVAWTGVMLAHAGVAETTGSLDAWNREARAKFAAQRFGIFVHWGLYSTYAQGEWYLQGGGGRIDEAAYARAKDGFYPSKFDARAWVALFKEAGAKYLTVTTRHHDGFSLWPTQADDGYNIAHTPFRRDVVGELAAACTNAGLQINFYYSLMDWHRKDYPAGRASKSVLGDQVGDYASYRKFMLAQIGELIGCYRPGNIWFDGEWDHAQFNTRTGQWERTLDWKFDEIYDFIHARKTLVANNNHQPIRAKEDIQLFERDLPGDHADLGFSRHQPVTNDRPVEQCDVLQHQVWGWKLAERKFRTAEEVVAMIARCAARGANMLMNVGPDGSGALPPQCVETLKGVGRWFARNGESIYGTEGAGVGLAKEIVSTRKGDVLYVHFLDPKATRFAFKYEGEIRSARCLATGAPVQVERTPSGVAVLTIAREVGDDFDYVVEVR